MRRTLLAPTLEAPLVDPTAFACNDQRWRPTVAVDFDGVIRDCRGTPGDPWRRVPGTSGALRRLAEQGYRVVVYSSREPKEITEFMLSNHLPFDEVVSGTDRKPLFSAVIDDRAIRFDGNWTNALHELARFRPYWRT